jgi:hypothetical protein
MPLPESDVFAKAHHELSLQLADQQPASITTLQTDIPPGYGSIALPGEGNLWVYFSFQGTPPAEAWLWNQVKLFTPLKPNVSQVLASHKGDRLVYKLGFAGQELTLSWGYE